MNSLGVEKDEVVRKLLVEKWFVVLGERKGVSPGIHEIPSNSFFNLIILVYSLSMVTPADYMIKRPSKFNSRPPCHFLTIHLVEKKNKNILKFSD
jgi:hypothetical protein